MTFTRYAFDGFTRDDAKQLDGKIATIETHDDPEMAELGIEYIGVRVMYPGGHPYLLIQHPEGHGDAVEIQLHTIKGVEVHS